MPRTMKWPPTPRSGRIDMVEGAGATRILVMQVLSDLQTNPFNDVLLSLGNPTFRTASAARARIQNALRRLGRVIRIESISEEGSGEDRTYTIDYVDLEVRQPGSVTVNG